MPNIKAVAARSLISSITPETLTRRESDLQTITSPYKRAAAILIHKTVAQYPRLTSRAMGLNWDALRSLDFVGLGYDSLVIKQSEETVLKLHMRSLTLDRPHQHEYAAQLADSYSRLAKYMGDFVLPQTTSVDGYPDSPRLQVVQTQQPFKPAIQDTGIFSRASEHIDVNALDRFYAGHPKAAAQLPAFARQSLKLYQNEGLLCDVIGTNNLVIDTQTSDLLLIDGAPLITTHIVTADRARQQLEELAALVS